jgi:hypothetical protein
MVRCGGLSRHKELVLHNSTGSIRQVSQLVFKISVASLSSICTLEAVLYCRSIMVHTGRLHLVDNNQRSSKRPFPYSTILYIFAFSPSLSPNTTCARDVKLIKSPENDHPGNTIIYSTS